MSELNIGTYGAKRQSWESGPRKLLRELCEQHPTWADNEILSTFHCEITKKMEDGNLEDLPHLTAYYGKPNLKAIREGLSETEPEFQEKPKNKASAADIAAAKNRKPGKARGIKEMKAAYVPSIFDTRILLDGRCIGDISYAELKPLAAASKRDTVLLSLILASVKRPADPNTKVRDLIDPKVLESLNKKASK